MAAAARGARRRGASQDRPVPVRALRREQAALGARPPAGGARSTRGGHALLGPAGELSRVPAARGTPVVGGSAVRGAHAVVEPAHTRLGPGAARAVRLAAGVTVAVVPA